MLTPYCLGKSFLDIDHRLEAGVSTIRLVYRVQGPCVPQGRILSKGEKGKALRYKSRMDKQRK